MVGNRSLFVLSVVVAMLLAACGGADASDGTGSEPPSGTPPAEATDGGDATDGEDDAGGGAAGGTAPRAYDVAEALESGEEGPLLVTGLLIDDGSGWQLCGAIAESYPPQCAGEAVAVEGIDDGWYELQEDAGVRWSEAATVFGELRNGVLTAVGDPAAA